MDLGKAEATRARHRERSAIFASAAGQPRTLFDSVRRRLVLVVLLALAPIAVLNIAQGVAQLSDAQEDARQRLLQQAVAAAGTQQNIFASTENVLYALKNVEEVRTSGPTCAATLRGATISLPFAANIGVLDAQGRVTCAALPFPGRAAGDELWWKDAMARTGFSLVGPARSPGANLDVLVGVLPLRDAAGRLEGAIALGIDISWLDNLLRQQTPPSAGIVALFSSRGQELVSNARAMSAALFQRELFQTAGQDLRSNLYDSTDPAGRHWTFATAPLGRDGLTVAFAMPSDRLFGWTFVTVAASIALPALIIVLSLAALWVAVDRIILRWLLYLRRVTAVYAQGHYGFRPTRLDAAPSEFRVLGHSVENMAFAVRHRDARLRENLAEKTALVREIHHRIKNSLQVVVSLLSLYGSGIGKSEDRRRFDQLRLRVNTLALVHRILYEANDGSQVHLRELLGELASLIEGSTDASVRITVEAQDVPLPTDMAVPLALMVVEVALNLALPQGTSPAPLVLSGSRRDDRLHLALRSGAGRWDEKGSTTDLATGFAAQLGGSLSRSDEVGGGMVVAGDFPCRMGTAPKTVQSD
ncbi:sensor histidine kinase [Xanthobacter autotrophicus]|uniref:sensor histidine kinase n=1 Tax=Xanthobacter autotrophicus TaxID=280 RepID=UPI0024A743AE|nr:sensor histidine kinase [Xanthobacter autotrophicus]MDI4658268.1 sensor histidine kinase [Xanthobacter autotrophicus]